MKLRRSLSLAAAAIACSLALGSWAAALPVAVAYPGLNNSLAAPSALEAQLLELMQQARDARNLPRFTWDAMTSAVAREQSEDMANNDYADYVSPRLGTLEYRLHRAGVSAGNAHFAVYRMPSVAAVMESLQKTRLHLQDSLTDIGIGIVKRGPRELLVTIILYEKHSQLDPFPTLPILGAEYRLSGRLESGLEKPFLVVTTPDGQVTERPLKLSSGRRFDTTVRFDKGSGEYSVEITASASLGPTVVDLMHCYAGVEYPPPTIPPKRMPMSADLREGAQLMFDLINKARAEAHLPALAYDERLSETARAHSEDMFENKYFAHDSPTVGNLAERMAKAGIKAKKFSENIADNQDLLAAHEELMDSPGHRKDILDPDLTRVGVGIVRAENGQLLVTEDFMEDFQTYDTSELAAQLIQDLNAARGTNGLAGLAESSALADIALENSSSMMANGKLDQSKAKALIAQRRPRLRYIQALMFESADPAAPARMAEALKARYQEVGVGIVQDSSPSGAKILWTTVLLGER
ncbi:MAG: CAP domain-containing protein [Candidatus Brocadiia bacterium]